MGQVKGPIAYWMDFAFNEEEDYAELFLQIKNTPVYGRIRLDKPQQRSAILVIATTIIEMQEELIRYRQAWEKVIVEVNKEEG